MDKVLLVNMPFGSANRPAIGISLLKGSLAQSGIHCDICYLQLPFVRQIGQSLYYQVAQFAPRTLIGEWLFAHHLFEGQLPAPEEYIDGILSYSSDIFTDEVITQLLHIRDLTGPYLARCVETVPWGQYDLIGFTSTFAQNMASLALAKRIKETWPEKTIVFGGANCEGEMGVELHRQFQFVDYVCSGESDWLFPELVRRLRAGVDVSDLKGLVYRKYGETISNDNHAQPVFDLDALPMPDYDDYFAQLAESGLEFAPEQMRLMIETGRGCWWGAKSQCIFCGMNNQTSMFRSKSSQRVLDEFTCLAEKYPEIKFVDATDKIMDMGYFQEVIPGLCDRNLGLNIFYFTKANMSREQLRQLQKAGIRRIQPGIESLDTSVLQLMRKGCTATQNIQLLKWASEIGLEVIWNYISGFPGEDPAAYQRMAEVIPSIAHLQPPTGDANHVRLDRFSPYFQDPAMHGMVNIRPAAAYRFVYPFPEESLFRLAYYFDFDYADGRHPDDYTPPLDQAIKDWHDHEGKGSLLSLNGNGRLTLYDTRAHALQRETVLEGAAKIIYEYCDEGRTLSSILRHLNRRDDLPGEQIKLDTVEAVLKPLVDAQVMLHVDDRYLSLAIPMDVPIQEFVDSYFASARQ